MSFMYGFSEFGRKGDRITRDRQRDRVTRRWDDEENLELGNLKFEGRRRAMDIASIVKFKSDPPPGLGSLFLLAKTLSSLYLK
jgi:hypothetical protein